MRLFIFAAKNVVVVVINILKYLQYFEGQQINDTHCYFMTTLMTVSPTFVLMILVVLLFYMIFSSIKRSRIEKLLTAENTFIIMFMLWFLVCGMHLIYHGIFGSFGPSCAVEDDLLSTSVYANVMLMVIVVLQLIAVFSIEAYKTAKDAVNLRRPEAVYNNLSIEVSNNALDTDDLDRPLRRLLYVHSILFLVFWAPFYGVRMMYYVDQKSHTLDLIVFQLFSYIIGYFKSAIAPIGTLIVYPESRYLIHKIKEADCWSWKIKNVISKN